MAEVALAATENMKIANATSQQQQKPLSQPQQTRTKIWSENFSNDVNCMDRMYHFLDELGSGGFGKVKLAVHILTGENVAIKIIDKKALANELPRIVCELEALKQLAHQNVCRMFQFVETEEKFFIVMEYCNGGEMFDYIMRKERLGESEARHFFRQLVQAVAYIHAMGFAHRDLKPENLLLTQDLQLKVIDFGLCAKPLNGLSRPLETCCGSPAYAAPELIQNHSYFGNEADIWSMGVLLYALLCGHLPFDDHNMARLYKKITMGHYSEPDYLTPLCREFIRIMITVDPRKRATIRQILAHPWINKNYEQQLKWQTIYSREIVDEEVLRELVYFYGTTTQGMMTRIKQWRFDYLTATYLILLQKKERKQSFVLPGYRGAAANMPFFPTIHASLDNDINISGFEDDAFNTNDGEESAEQLLTPTQKKLNAMNLRSPPIFSHSPQQLGKRTIPAHSSPNECENSRQPLKDINNCSNIQNQQSTSATTQVQQQKPASNSAVRNRYPGIPLYHYNNMNGENGNCRPKSVYTTPRRGAPMPITGLQNTIVPPSPMMYRRPYSAERPTRCGATSPKTPAVQNSFRSNSTDRPSSVGANSTPPSSGERLARIDTRERDDLKSPSNKLRQRVFSSLERKADKMINLLTPKKIKSDAPMKLKCIKTVVNVSVTSSTDPMQVRDELWKVLLKQGMETTQNGWKVCGSKKSPTGATTVVELEVVAIENLQYVGVKRKRIQGDAFMYKHICEEVLRLAGL